MAEQFLQLLLATLQLFVGAADMDIMFRLPGKTALMQAIFCRHWQLVQLLLELRALAAHGADDNAASVAHVVAFFRRLGRTPHVHRFDSRLAMHRRPVALQTLLYSADHSDHFVKPCPNIASPVGPALLLDSPLNTCALGTACHG